MVNSNLSKFEQSHKVISLSSARPISSIVWLRLSERWSAFETYIGHCCRNKLSVVFDDKDAARETLDRCRAFCAARPTVWLGTHTPEALESLEQHRVVDLANPPAVIPPGEIVFKTPTGKYICSVCGYVYDPAEHDGVAFEDLPADWRCPRCK